MVVSLGFEPRFGDPKSPVIDPYTTRLYKVRQCGSCTHYFPLKRENRGYVSVTPTGTYVRGQDSNLCFTCVMR